ncbi:hypothetical protein DL98DRAFT_657644 [Cadophora sp. DSE1049]|nr:hypothetical protein DL98DRAFT_657644 [Cadophora sp. DSE1049]
MVACVFCKEKKQKCDGQAPSCGSCSRLGKACLVEDPTSKRQTPRNYLQSLEERVAMLESLLQNVRPEVANDHFSSFETLGSSSFSQESQFSSFSGPTECFDDSDELSAKVGLLALNAPGTEPRYLGSSSAFAFSRVVNSSLRRLQTKGAAETRMSGANSGMPQMVLPCPMPSPKTGEMLSKAYFEHVHTQYPFLHEATFRDWEQRIMGNLDDASVDPVGCFFVNIIYAVGALVLPRSYGCSPEGFHASAQLYMDYVIELDSIESIQAILCCAMYSLRSPVGVSVWSLAGLALRQCIELGYHRSARKFDLSLDPLRLEMRRRVFWCSYGIDRAASMTLGRPFGIPDQEIDIEYPSDIDDSLITPTGILGQPRTSTTEPPTSMSAAIHTFKLRRIWSQIHISLYSSLDTNERSNSANPAHTEYLHQQLREWRDTSPQISTETTLSVFDSNSWFKLAYDHSLLLLYRGQLTRHYPTPEERPQRIFMECSRAARDICLEYRRVFIKQQPVSYTWGALNILFLAGLTYLHCLWTSDIRVTIRQDEISNTCTACTMVLVVLAERWEQAAPYRDIFEALASKTMAMVVDKHHEMWMAPDVSVIEQPGSGLSFPGEMGQWVTNIADVGMSDGIGSLLTGLIYDFGVEGSVDAVRVS